MTAEKKLPKPLLERAYLLLLALASFEAFWGTTMIPAQPTRAMRLGLLALCALVVALRLLFGEGRSPARLAAAAAVLALFAWDQWVLRGEQWFLLELALFAVGARGVPFRKIVKTYLAATLPLLLVTMALSLSGAIENLVYLRRGVERYAFGICYPTDFCAHVFFLTACAVWLRAGKQRWIEIAMLPALAAFCMVFCEARNTVLCLCLLTAGLVYCKLRRSFAAKKGREYRMNGAVSALLAAAAPLLAAGMIALTLAYTPDSPWMQKLDAVFATRLSLGREAFDSYPVPMLAQLVYMRGLGSTHEYEGAYFWLDSSYINVLLRLGLPVLLLALGVLVYCALRQRKLGAWERLGLLAVIALQCTVEHHLIELAYHPFLLLALAGDGEEPAAGEERL